MDSSNSSGSPCDFTIFDASMAGLIRNTTRLENRIKIPFWSSHPKAIVPKSRYHVKEQSFYLAQWIFYHITRR